jgi:non-specific serine/threonine protein kinase
MVLDNFEQVIESAPLIARMLVACPRLAVLVTSREPIHLSGERIVVVPPLPLPDPKGAAEVLAATDAVRLFVDRATAAHAEFVLTTENTVAVAEICRRLDGLPLAIELAAARVAHLPPSALLARLARKLPVLTGGARDVPARQRTVRATIAWSHDLLTADEQRLFRCLAVFAGGCRLDAAEWVMGDGFPVLDGIASLVAKSLMRQEEEDGEPRYLMLETVREYGLERLEASGEAGAVGQRHADYYLALAAAAAAGIADVAPDSWVTRMAAEQANLRTALARLRDCGEVGAGLRFAAALGGFWRLRSSHAEGRAWLEAFLAQPGVDSTPATDRVTALRWAGELAGLLGDSEGARQRLAASLALARRVGDRPGIAAALAATASALLLGGDVTGSIAPFEEAVSLTRDLGKPRQLAFLLAYLSFAVGLQGDVPRGEALLTESEDLLRALEDTHSFEFNLAMLCRGWLALMAGNHARSLPPLMAARDIGEANAAGSVLSIAWAGLGEVALARGQVGEAADSYCKGLRSARDGEFPAGVVFNLQGIVRIGSHWGEPVRAARLVGAMDALGATVGVLPSAVSAPLGAALDRIQLAAGREAFAAERAIGRMLSPQGVDAEALKVAEDLVLASNAQPGSAFSLTPRERDVLALLVMGKSNPAIGEALFISPRTAQTHVINLLAKLGVSSRAEAAALAIRDGLV